MYVIGVTGSIGSGKSTVSRMLADWANVSLVDADRIARDIVEPGKDTLIALADIFGSKILTKDSLPSLDRSKLAEIVFNDPAERQKLNAIMFPAIRKRVLEHFDAHMMLGKQYIIYDAPLLFESGTDDLVNYTVLVYVPRDVQMKRIKKRNGLSDKQVAARINSQASGDDMLKRPHDFLIRNTMSFNALKSTVATLWEDIQGRAVGPTL